MAFSPHERFPTEFSPSETDNTVIKSICFEVPFGKQEQVCFLAKYHSEMAQSSINFRVCLSDMKQVTDKKR